MLGWFPSKNWYPMSADKMNCTLKSQHSAEKSVYDGHHL